MEGQGRLIGGLVLVLTGVLGVCLTCGLPMWRETSFVGANIVTAQSVWDGLWLHCILQSTGQMQCKTHTTPTTMTSDIQAGRALTLLSILAGLLGFVVTLLGGGVVNCSGAPPDPFEPPSTSTFRKKASLLGGILCILAAILCLVPVSWSAAVTNSVYNDPLVTAALKREVGTSIYVGLVSGLLLLLGGTLICCICGPEERRLPPRDYVYRPPSTYGHYGGDSGRPLALRSDQGSSSAYDRYPRGRDVEHVAQVHAYDSLKGSLSSSRMYDQHQRRPADHWPLSA